MNNDSNKVRPCHSLLNSSINKLHKFRYTVSMLFLVRKFINMSSNSVINVFQHKFHIASKLFISYPFPLKNKI